MVDQSFDGRSQHLEKNIYNSEKGKLRLAILKRDLIDVIDSEKKLSILDVGCGVGMMSEWALQFGHSVHACDISQEMLHEAQFRLRDYDSVTFFLGCINELSDRKYDIIFCHAVLEWVEDQNQMLDKLSSMLTPNGVLSLMFYNAWAREMSQLVYGNFEYINKDYNVRKRVKLSPHWPAAPDVIEEMLFDLGFDVYGRSGIRIFFDIMRDRSHYDTYQQDIIHHELRISQQYPYWQLGRYVHFLARKKEII